MRKTFVLSAIIFTMAVSPIQIVQAHEINIITQLNNENANVQRADVIVTKYRVNNGITQYRRWNENRGCWVDPDWIDLN